MPRVRETSADPLLTWASDVQRASAAKQYVRLDCLLRADVPICPARAPPDEAAAAGTDVMRAAVDTDALDQRTLSWRARRNQSPPRERSRAPASSALHAVERRELEAVWRAEHEAPLRERLLELDATLRQVRAALSSTAARAQVLGTLTGRCAEHVAAMRDLRRSWGAWRSRGFERRRRTRVEEICAFAREQVRIAADEAVREVRERRGLARRASAEPTSAPESCEPLARARGSAHAHCNGGGAVGAAASGGVSVAASAARLELHVVALEEALVEAGIEHGTQVSELQRQVTALSVDEELHRRQNAELQMQLRQCTR
ncbi:hypothetical protein KFE25_013637 [Diacronema lutheri]|uniref:Uncharacterized protein n=2 Tax=Diacronema lutheri TaxID=2081491 RepID=A0A8J5XQP1_DIALT|nr:hypothetical protein KFE25_013637 [Diacronema lutheri]